MTRFSAQIIGIDTEQKTPVEELKKVKLKHFPVVEVDDTVLLGNNEISDLPCQEEMDL